MLIKQNSQYQLQANISAYRGQHSLSLTQFWPQAQNPHARNILQVLLNKDELRAFGEYLIAASQEAEHALPKNA